MNIMDYKEKPEEHSPSLPVLSRLDRLDRLLQLLEERHYLSETRYLSPVITKQRKEDECKTLSSALEEVNHKGTLMERLTMLETRVLQLSLEMEVGNTSKSSSFTIQMPEKTEPKSRAEEDIIDTLQQQEKQESTLVEARETKSQECQKGRRRRRRQWLGLGWFRMGC